MAKTYYLFRDWTEHDEPSRVAGFTKFTTLALARRELKDDRSDKVRFALIEIDDSAFQRYTKADPKQAVRYIPIEEVI